MDLGKFADVGGRPEGRPSSVRARHALAPARAPHSPAPLPQGRGGLGAAPMEDEEDEEAAFSEAPAAGAGGPAVLSDESQREWPLPPPSPRAPLTRFIRPLRAAQRRSSS